MDRRQTANYFSGSGYRIRQPEKPSRLSMMDQDLRCPSNKDDAPALAALIPLESAAAVVLPNLLLLVPREIIDFRFENVRELQSFRLLKARAIRS